MGNGTSTLEMGPLEIKQRYDKFVAAKDYNSATLEAKQLEEALKAGLLDLGGAHSMSSKH